MKIKLAALAALCLTVCLICPAQAVPIRRQTLPQIRPGPVTRSATPYGWVR